MRLNISVTLSLMLTWNKYLSLADKTKKKVDSKQAKTSVIARQFLQVPKNNDPGRTSKKSESFLCKCSHVERIHASRPFSVIMHKQLFMLFYASLMTIQLFYRHSGVGILLIVVNLYSCNVTIDEFQCLYILKHA